MDEQDRLALTTEKVRRVLFQYCRGVDRFDWDLVRGAFWPGARLRYGAETTVDEFIDRASTGLAIYQVTQHLVGNVLVEQFGDVATSEAYCQARHRYYPDENGVIRDFVWGGRYVDKLTAGADGSWRIDERTVVHEWTDIRPVGETWPDAGSFAQGGQSEDPWQQLLEATRHSGTPSRA